MNGKETLLIMGLTYKQRFICIKIYGRIDT